MRRSHLLIANLLDLKEAAAIANVLLADLLSAEDNVGAGGARDAVVVRLLYAANHGDVGLGQVVLRQVRDALLGDDQVRLEADNVIAHLLNELLLNLEHSRKVRLVGDLNVSLTFALLVLEATVEQENSRVLNASGRNKALGKKQRN